MGKNTYKSILTATRIIVFIFNWKKRRKLPAIVLIHHFWNFPLEYPSYGLEIFFFSNVAWLLLRFHIFNGLLSFSLFSIALIFLAMVYLLFFKNSLGVLSKYLLLYTEKFDRLEYHFQYLWNLEFFSCLVFYF